MIFAGAQRGLCRVADALAGLTGWRRLMAALVLGALAALALPPWHIVPLLLVGFTGLVWLLDGAALAARPVRAATLTGFFFGLGHFAVGIHWLAEAFLVDPVRHGWMIPFALGGLSSLLGLFVAGACALTVWLCRRFAVGAAGRVLMLAACWTLFEWLRGWVLTGFPWNLAGHVWTFSPTMVQAAALAGVFGLSLLTVTVAAMPAVLTATPCDARSRIALLAALVLLPLLAAGGALRLSNAPSYAVPAPGSPANPSLVEDVRLRIVQAGIPQRLKWRAEFRRDHLMRHVALSRAAGGIPPTHIVWPETAVPYFLVNDAAAREVVAQAVPRNGLLLTGTVRYEAAEAGGRRLFNSAIALAGDGTIRAVYDKVHLVPFGEYVPLGALLPLDKIVTGAGDFVSGAGPEVLELPGLPAFAPLICYEAIFPDSVSASPRRHHWLLNLTNDGWFGTGAGPRQHLAISAMRAVEQGLPLVRSAGTGISAVIDPYGREIARLEIGAIGVLDTGLPRPLPPTLFAEYGAAIYLILTALFFALALGLFRQHRV